MVQEPVFTHKDEPLRNDVGFLGQLLGDVLREQGGDALFDAVEAARLAARGRRQGDTEAETRLDGVTQGLEPTEATQLVHAFSAYFGLVNMAERVHRIRRRREYLMSGSEPQTGSLLAVVRGLKEAGVGFETLAQTLSALRVEPVFTAHPTEAIRRTLLVKEQQIARALIERLSPDLLTGEERASILGRLRTEITTAWQTAAIAGASPTIADEVEHIAFYLDDVIFRTLPRLLENLEGVVEEVYGQGLPEASVAGLMRFASWVGGDMDGNPNVGPDTIRASLLRHRALVLRRYEGCLKGLFQHLSQSAEEVGVSATLLARIAALQDEMPDALGDLRERHREMPYRVLLSLMHRKLQATQSDATAGYSGPEAFAADLALIAESLLAHRGRHAGWHSVRRLQRQVAAFGFHLARLDVRQDALVHREAVAEWLGEPNFVSASAAERRARLEGLLVESGSPRSPGPALERTLGTLRAIGEARAEFGREALGPYILSMTQGVDDVLALLFLARAAGLADADGQVPLDIVPLFETEQDLDESPRVMEELATHVAYREHLAGRGDGQMVMLGYSDSSKRAGIMASRWALQRAQEGLVGVAARHHLRLQLFHGRGGSIGRGGSKPREAVLAEPPGAVAGYLRVTEQGEIIHAKYGLRGIALRTFELATGAVLEATLKPNPEPIPAEARQVAQLMADASRQSFRAVAYDDPKFYPYFRSATPIDVIERLRIGSRPPSRRAQKGIDDLRAIPWVFSWVQSRHLLPGWLGLESGLAAAIDALGLPEVRRWVQRWSFLSTLVGDVEMVLAKADMDIAARYAALAGDEGAPVFADIKARYERCVSLVCDVRESDALLTAEPVLRRAISLRNPYVDPMSFVQVDLLTRWRATDRNDPALEQALHATVLGIARGLQNTG